jgi:uncharacterized membrane protein (UPF0127 family)
MNSEKSPALSGCRTGPDKIFLFCTAVFLLLCAGCPGEERTRRLPALDLVIEGEGGESVPVRAEIARSPAEREKGLMFRRNIEDGEGMLFVFDRDQVLSFWMENTYIPLSIAYIAYNGRIIDIFDMRPLDRSTVSSTRSVRYALEVPRGWFERAGIRPGDVLRLEPVLRFPD